MSKETESKTAKQHTPPEVEKTIDFEQMESSWGCLWDAKGQLYMRGHAVIARVDISEVSGCPELILNDLVREEWLEEKLGNPVPDTNRFHLFKPGFHILKSGPKSDILTFHGYKLDDELVSLLSQILPEFGIFQPLPNHPENHPLRFRFGYSGVGFIQPLRSGEGGDSVE